MECCWVTLLSISPTFLHQIYIYLYSYCGIQVPGSIIYHYSDDDVVVIAIVHLILSHFAEEARACLIGHSDMSIETCLDRGWCRITAFSPSPSFMLFCSAMAFYDMLDLLPITLSADPHWPLVETGQHPAVRREWRLGTPHPQHAGCSLDPSGQWFLLKTTLTDRWSSSREEWWIHLLICIKHIYISTKPHQCDISHGCRNHIIHADLYQYRFDKSCSNLLMITD